MIEAGEVAVDLGEPRGERVRLVVAPHLELDRQDTAVVADQQVHPSRADRVLALDGAAAANDAMEEGRQHEVRGDLVVGRRAEEGLAVLPPERQEGVEEPPLVELPPSVSQVGRIWGSEATATLASERGMTSR